MFDVGFWELMFIGVIALLVLGPERLPRVARTAGLWLGKARGMLATVKADIDRELAAEELKRALAKQAELPGLHEIIEETEEAVKDLTLDDLSRPTPPSKPKPPESLPQQKAEQSEDSATKPSSHDGA